jgi:hypothetical protein
MKTYLKVEGGLSKLLAEAVHVLHIPFGSHTRETAGLVRRVDSTAFPPLGLSPRMDACMLAGLCCVAHAS